MINGIAPLLVFQFPAILPLPALSGIPIVGDILGAGFPIPLYLDEKLTGVYVSDESMALTVDTEVEIPTNGTPPLYNQRGVENEITVSMLAQKDSIVLTTLIALMDITFKKLVATKYSVSYLNGSTVILGGLVSGFSTQVGSNDDLIRVVLHLQKKDQKTKPPIDPGLAPNVSKTAGSALGPLK